MSCLFNSLSHFIDEDSLQIRLKICDYLQENNPIIDGIETHEVLRFENANVHDYITNMRFTSTWGGAIEIQCACNIWNIRINVKNCRDQDYRVQDYKVIEFLPCSNNYEKTIELYWTGGHYEPVR
jgi:hypothetical protein